MLIQLYIVGLAALINSFFGVFIYLRNPRVRANQSYLILTIVIVSWMLASFLTDYGWSSSVKFLSAQLTYVGGLIIIGGVLHLANSLPRQQHYTKWDKTITWLLIMFACLCFTPLVVSGIEPIHGVTIIKPGPLYALYIIVFMCAGIKAAKAFYRQWHRADNVGRKQIRTMAIGINVGLLLGLATNAILPVVFGLSYATALGPFATVVFVIVTGYAIIRHHMFDIRYILVRFMAYILSVAVIVLLFSIFAFSLIGIIFGQQEISTERSIYYIATAVLIAISFEPLKNLINKVTNNLFFRKSYSVHVALNEISSYSTRSVEAKQIQLHTLKVVDDTIRPEYAGFVMFDQHNILSLEVSSDTYPTKTLQLEGFINELGKLRQKLTTADDVKETAHLRHYLELAHIGVITRLSTSNKSIGFLILGEKKNGGSYNSHDLQFLTLMANDLALALQNAKRYEEIQAFNATLQYKVADATKALKRTNEKLIALDDAKDDFISMASHQLRTPLTSIKGYLSMTLDGDLGKITPAQRQALKEAFDSSQRMVFLISDFLNVSRIRTGKFALEMTETNLTNLVNEEIGQLREMAGLRGQKMIFKAPMNFPVVRLDEMKTRQVMMNMIDNAIFYTPKDGTIEIVLEKTKTEIIFKVIDSGIGVPIGDQHRLFTKFFRAANAKNARPDGTGLGLFMAQKIIAAQDGKIIFASTEGQGSTFGFRFPLGKVGLKTS